MDKQPISRKGFDKMQLRLRQLKEVDRPAILEAIQHARELGDLSENADYKTAKDVQRQIDYEIRHIESIVNNANIVDVDSLCGDKVMFGATVVVEDSDGKKGHYKILAECEADICNNVISITSPLARGFVGKCVGDYCVIKTPSGEKEYEIIEIKYGQN
jgi:transcription elongation factor GreA